MTDSGRTSLTEQKRPMAITKGPSKLLKGAAVLGVAAIISKLLGTLQKIPLQNIAGDEVFGLYSAIYPFYLFLLFLATAGIPTAISILVAEQAAAGNQAGANRVARLSAGLMLGTGILFFGLTYAGADIFARWIGVSGTSGVIRSVAWAMLLIPVMSALRGYFQGHQNMVPVAVSQVMEQFVRVTAMVAALLWLTRMNADAETLAGAALFGSAAGAVGGLLVLVTTWTRSVRKHKKQQLLDETPGWKLLQRILLLSLPICMGTITVPLMNIVDTFTLPRLLQIPGVSAEEAMRRFGLYNHGLPLVQLVSLLAASVTAALVPSLAEARALGQQALVRARANTAISLAWLIGLPSAVGLALTSRDVNVSLFATAEGTAAMAVLASTALFSTLTVVATSVLNGLGDARTPAVAMLIAVVVKTTGNVVLVPRYGITGGAIAATIAFAVAAAWLLVRVQRRTGILARGESPARLMGPIAACGVMGLAVLALQYGGEAAAAAAGLALQLRLAATVRLLAAICGGAVVYLVALMKLNALDPELARYIPGRRPATWRHK